MKRISIKELTEATGLSRATIDRAMNDRGGVHPRTRQIIDATLERLSQPAPAIPPERLTGKDFDVAADVVLRVGRGLMKQLEDARALLDCPSLRLFDMFQKDDLELVDLVRELCRDKDRPLVLTAKNSEPLRAELVAARRRGKVIITMVSDLAQDARQAFVGIDNRMAGQTVAFLVGNILKHRSAKVGVVLGDYAFSCHEDREIGFRSNLRTNFPSVVIADIAKGEDSPEQTHSSVANLLDAHPDLDAIYNVAGGNLGLAQAVREAGRAHKLVVITHEANHITVPLVREGILDFVVSQDPRELLRSALEMIALDKQSTIRTAYLNFGLYTQFNLPRYDF